MTTKHPILTQERMQELISELSAVRYDSLMTFLSMLGAELFSQGFQDSLRGRYKLSAQLKLAASLLDGVVTQLQKAWEICEPHMKDQ